jgi:LemA protein
VIYIVPVVLVALVGWAIMKYNSLVTLRNQTLNGWKQIDVQLKRRHDLIPNLVNTVKGLMQFEQETKENALTGALSKLFALVENYPNLKSNENVKQLQEELTSTENKISFARQFFNDIATRFNTSQQTFPGNIIASMFSFKLSELFEITDAAERDVPNVDLSLKK